MWDWDLDDMFEDVMVPEYKLPINIDRIISRHDQFAIEQAAMFANEGDFREAEKWRESAGYGGF